MIKNYILILIFLSTITLLNADDSIDNLLCDIKHKSDLSQKTQIANAGISLIYTRSDIQRMQAKYLKDILKSSYLTKYFENRYGAPDPYTQGFELIPFKSSTTRVYIDNQEITMGIYGSGTSTHGDIDIGFVDHIEIYTQSPTYEYSTESTTVLIKMYSKSTLKDEGAKVELNTGSYGASRISGYFAQDFSNDISHFTYASFNNDKREKHYPSMKKVSRDKKVNHIFSSIMTKNHKVLIDITDQKRDAFIAQSTDSTPSDATVNMQSMHIGYDGKYNDFSFLATYDYSDTDYLFVDDVTPIAGLHPISEQSSSIKSHVLTAGLKYNFNTQNNKLTAGIKYRNISYNRKFVTINNAPLPQPKNNTQTIATIFMENKYSLADNKIFTLGLKLSDVQNNHSQQNDTLFMYRLGFTYLYDKWISKTIFSHSETSLEPYLVDKFNVYITPGVKKPQEFDYLTQNIIFEKDENIYELILSYIKYKNSLLSPTPTASLLDNFGKNIYTLSALIRWTHTYNKYDKLFFTLECRDTDNMYNLNHTKNYTALIRNLNTYKKMDFYSELIFNKDSIVKKNYYDLNLGVTYNYNKHLTFSLKGENLLDDAEQTIFTRKDPLTLQTIEPFNVSAIDKKVTLSLEYYF
jgi:iron complex outermembrane receptor protein